MVAVNVSLDEEISLYSTSGLTPTELFILRLLFLAANGDSALLVKYSQNVSNGKEIIRICLGTLRDKQVINKTFKVPKVGEHLNFKKIPFNKNFVKRYFKEANVLGKELFEGYPPFIDIRGRKVSIRNIAKIYGVSTFDDFCKYYAKEIKNSVDTHNKVMEALEFGKENNLISYGIHEFIVSRKWNEIEMIQESDDINGYQNSELI